MPSKGSSKLQTRTYSEYTFKKQTYKAGDDVHVLCDDGHGPKISIGQIKEFRIPVSAIAEAARQVSKASSAAAAAALSPSDENGVDPNKVDVQLVWWYRPEEARGGRKQFHGEREVFKSAHQDVVPAVSLDGPARVLTLAAYQSLNSVKPGDYYYRFDYLPNEERFKPEKVPIYCRCNMPYNPDTFMLMCSVCEDWFHPRCVGLSRDGVQAAISEKEYRCLQCSASLTLLLKQGGGGGGGARVKAEARESDVSSAEKAWGRGEENGMKKSI